MMHGQLDAWCTLMYVNSNTKYSDPNFSKVGNVPDENSDGAGSGSNIGSGLNHARLCLQLQRSVKKLNSSLTATEWANMLSYASRLQRCRQLLLLVHSGRWGSLQSVMLHMLAVAMTSCHVDAKFDRAPSNICAIWFRAFWYN